MEKLANKKNVKNIVAASLAVAAVAVLWWKLSGPPSLEYAAKYTLAAIEAGDGRKAMRFLEKEEIEALKLTPENLTLLLNTIKSYQSEPINQFEPKIKEDKGTGYYGLGKNIMFPENKEMYLGVQAVRTDEGPKVICLIYSLFIASASEDFPVDQNKRTGLNKLKLIIDAYPRVKEKFASAGINGIYLTNANETYNYTLDEYYKHITEKYVLAQKREADYVMRKQNGQNGEQVPQ